MLNLADMRFNLFEAAVGPALVTRYRTKSLQTVDQRIQYLVPKTSWAISQAEIVSIPPEDRTEFPPSEVLLDLRADRAPRVWKERFWGTPRDWKFLDRLSELPPLSAIAGPERSKTPPRWIIAEGLQPMGESDDPKNAKTVALPTRLFVQANAIANVFVLSKSDCEKLPEAQFRTRRRTNTTIFKSPHVLVSKGLNVAFADFPVVFRHAVRGIHGPTEDRDLLLFLAAYLRSPLARYFLFHTSSRWGIERAEVEVAELLRVPFPLPDQTHSPSQTKALVRKIARKVEAFSGRDVAVLEDRKQLIQDLQSDCNALVYDYFAIDEVERALVEDTVSITMESILPPRATAKLPTLKESSPEYRKRYTDILCSTLNDWARDGAYRIQGHAQSSAGSGMAVVVLDRTKNGNARGKRSGSNPEELLPLLARLQSTFKTDVGSVELLRGVKVFDKDSLYLFKSLDQRFWTHTAALNDADEIASTVLMRSRQERQG